MQELRAQNVEVIGVSGEPFDRQCEFAKSLGLDFPLLADRDGSIAASYGAKRLLVSYPRRITYIIDPDGKIAAVFHHELRIQKHEADVRLFFESLR